MEEWRTVVYDGEVFEGYEVSNMGRVRSLNYKGHGKVQELKPFVTRGYLQVNVCKGGKMKKCYVHRLVAFAFIENDNPIEKTEINHISEDKTDNRVDNLSWVTPKQNINHGTHNERVAKALSKKVKCIETGVVYESTMDVERKLGLTHSNICKCCKGKLKTCGGYHWEYYSDYLELQKEKQNIEEKDLATNEVA